MQSFTPQHSPMQTMQQQQQHVPMEHVPVQQNQFQLQQRQQQAQFPQHAPMQQTQFQQQAQFQLPMLQHASMQQQAPFQPQPAVQCASSMQQQPMFNQQPPHQQQQQQQPFTVQPQTAGPVKTSTRTIQSLLEEQRAIAAAPAAVPPMGMPWSAEDYAADDQDDDDLNSIDTTNMTAEEKDQLRKLRKARKMNREKAKRAKLNDQFVHLSKMLAIGQKTRVEKLTVLTETIRQLESLQMENDGLRDQKRRMKEELHKRRTRKEALAHHSSGATTGALLKVPTPQPLQPMHFHNGFHKDNKGQFAWPQPMDSAVDNRDLDFAFGNDDDEEMGFFADNEDHLQKLQQKFQMQVDKNMQSMMHMGGMGMGGFGHFQMPNEFDNIDMFLANDDTSDLLCV